MKPHYRLKFLNKKTEETGEIGAVWVNEDGSMTLVLNPMVTVVQSRDIVLTLFPVDAKSRWDMRRTNQRQAAEQALLAANTTLPEEPDESAVR